MNGDGYKALKIGSIVGLLVGLLIFCPAAGHSPWMTPEQISQAQIGGLILVTCFILLLVAAMGQARAPRDTFGSAHFAGAQALQDAGLSARGRNGARLELGMSEDRHLVAIPEHLQ